MNDKWEHDELGRVPMHRHRQEEWWIRLASFLVDFAKIRKSNHQTKKKPTFFLFASLSPLMESSEVTAQRNKLLSAHRAEILAINKTIKTTKGVYK